MIYINLNFKFFTPILYFLLLVYYKGTTRITVFT